MLNICYSQEYPLIGAGAFSLRNSLFIVNNSLRSLWSRTDSLNKLKYTRHRHRKTLLNLGGGSELFPATEKIYKEVKHELGPDVLLVFGYGKIMG